MEFVRWRTQSLDGNHNPIGEITYHGMFKLDEYDMELMADDLKQDVETKTTEVKNDLGENTNVDKHYIRISEEDEAVFNGECLMYFKRLLNDKSHYIE